MKLLKTLAATALVAFGSTASADELSLAYFMGPKHPMNKGIFTPFAEKVAEASGGSLTIKMFPGGALNKVPPKQYSILLDGVADVVFTLPGYTADVFPKTNVVGLPGVCDSAVHCTEALQRVRPELEKEYNAKVISLWSNSPPVLFTRDKPVRSLADIQGMKIRVTSKGDAPFVEALGASAVAQPVSVINQNLANGVIDAIMIDPSAVRSFKLSDVANYATDWFPGSGSAFALLMNKDVYDDLSDAERAAVDAASSADLALNAAAVFDKASAGGMKLAAESGMEIITISDEEKAKFQAKIDEAMINMADNPVGDSTIGEMIKKLKGM